MLDHVFTDAIGALRDALEKAMLERQAFEERFQADVLLGDVTWATSYGLPGEGRSDTRLADMVANCLSQLVSGGGVQRASSHRDRGRVSHSAA